MRRVTTTPPTAPITSPPITPTRSLSADLQHDRPLAQALFAVWSGDPAVVIDSPPGAGKTHLITRLAALLHDRAGLRVAIAAQTRAQAVNVANRTAATGTPVGFVTNRESMPSGLTPGIETDPLRHANRVLVGTTARWLWIPRAVDVLLIDEAYQLTFGDLGALGSMADQFVLVGDPGQIDPVVTGETRRWETWASGPHVPAPTALIAAHRDDVTSLRLPHTWRLGQATTDLLAPLYPSLAFTSARPPRHITLAGDQLPEYRSHAVTTTAGVADPTMITTAASLARDLITHGTVTSPDGTRTLTAADVAVIAPHVEQSALISAALTDHPDLFVGTINQAQGLQREAVIAVHPLLGHDVHESFALDLGRLCVALSRHRAHVTVITDSRTPGDLAHALTNRSAPTALRTHADLLNRLANT